MRVPPPAKRAGTGCCFPDEYAGEGRPQTPAARHRERGSWCRHPRAPCNRRLPGASGAERRPRCRVRTASSESDSRPNQNRMAVAARAARMLLRSRDVGEQDSSSFIRCTVSSSANPAKVSATMASSGWLAPCFADYFFQQAPRWPGICLFYVDVVLAGDVGDQILQGVPSSQFLPRSWPAFLPATVAAPATRKILTAFSSRTPRAAHGSPRGFCPPQR